MRVSFVTAFLFAACGVASAQSVTPSGDPGSSVSVNLDALPIPVPRPKPSASDMRPLAQVRPRAKPELDTADVATPEGTRVTTALVAAPVATPAPPATPAVAPAAVRPPPPPAVPVTIVSSSADEFPVEISGVAANPFANAKAVNPLEGFAILSRVRFGTGKTEIPAQAQTSLDTLVQRLLTTRERVRLAAFSGRAGDLSSTARRLSLARALAIRTYLSAKGISTERIDVLAFGGATDGISDRVDVLVRGI